MSLLMDALKRAETSKQKANRALTGNDTERPAPDDELSLEPLGPAPARSTGKALPDLANHLDDLDADLTIAALSTSAPPPRAAPPPKEKEERETIRNAFAAKLVEEPPSRLPLWLALGTLLVAGLCIAAYVWFQLSSMGESGLASPTTAPSPPPLAAKTGNPLPAVPISPPTVFAPTSPSTVSNTFREPESPAMRPSRREYTQRAAIQDDNPAEASVPIRLTRTRPEPDANLARGHANLQRRDFDLARRDFEQALQRDPNNTDALLALGAIAQQQGRGADATQLRQRALIADPSDPAVQAAALSENSAYSNPQTTESRLKTLIAAQPESPQLNFALANLYARQNRWSEAQPAYFNAVAGDADNPDYLFNLAVSLDHMKQGRLAAQHYRLALDAATKRPAAFDTAQVKNRLSALQP